MHRRQHAPPEPPPARVEQGHTAVFLAAQRGYAGTLVTLLAAKADPSLPEPTVGGWGWGAGDGALRRWREAVRGRAGGVCLW